MGFLLGYDIGSSFVKTTLLDMETGRALAWAQAPDSEMTIDSPKSGWAEQNPSDWWNAVISITRSIAEKYPVEMSGVKAVGISYQMHGLVLVDAIGKVLRPAIIWCDSRAVQIGNEAANKLGHGTCFENLCNLPGNFTASKLKWVKENEPEIFDKASAMLLPGDYIAFRLTGELSTTESGLSEGILWDFAKGELARALLDIYEISDSLIPSVKSNFSHQGTITRSASEELGIPEGIPVTYRSGDQPNNALSLNVMEPGALAMTAGTSGVVYGISDKKIFDSQSRVNVFSHVNHTAERMRLGVLLCVNGSGCANSWVRRMLIDSGNQPMSYAHMDALAKNVSVGADGLSFIPYGNGSERTLNNVDPGASLFGLRFNVHSQAHIIRSCQEGVAFALNYGVDIMRSMGMSVIECRAGNANMFKSSVFTEALATITDTTIELFDTDGAQGAARGAGIGARLWDKKDAFRGLTPLRTITPDLSKREAYIEAYNNWKSLVDLTINRKSQ